jgi:predicted negative regulator of RcsB-dependent stress response
MDSEATVQSKAIAFQAWVEVNKKRLAIGVAVGAVVILAIALFLQQQAQKERVASRALSDVKVPWNPADKAPGVPEALAKVADEYKGTKAAERALLTSAAFLFSDKKYSEAEARFTQFIRAYPDTPWAPEASMGIAASLDAQGKTAEAISKYEEIRRRFTTSPIIDDAKLSLARLYEAQKPEEAYKLYDELAKSGPGTRMAMDASMRQEDLLKARPELAKLKEAMAPPTMQNIPPAALSAISNQMRMTTTGAVMTPQPGGTSQPIQIKLTPSPAPAPAATPAPATAPPPAPAPGPGPAPTPGK